MLHLSACRCTETEWTRVKRAGWMRALFPARRLFKCGVCHRLVLVRPDTAERRASLTLIPTVLGAASAVAVAALTLVWLSPDSQFTGSNVTADRPRPHSGDASCQRIHMFKEGETLESIAEQELGDSSKWQEIRIANHWLDLAPDGLEAGARLVVPSPCAG